MRLDFFAYGIFVLLDGKLFVIFTVFPSFIAQNLYFFHYSAKNKRKIKNVVVIRLKKLYNK